MRAVVGIMGTRLLLNLRGQIEDHKGDTSFYLNTLEPGVQMSSMTPPNNASRIEADEFLWGQSSDRVTAAAARWRPKPIVSPPLDSSQDEPLTPTEIASQEESGEFSYGGRPFSF